MARCTPLLPVLRERGLPNGALPGEPVACLSAVIPSVSLGSSFAHGPASAASHEDRTGHHTQPHTEHTRHTKDANKQRNRRGKRGQTGGVYDCVPHCAPRPPAACARVRICVGLLRGSELSPRLVGSWLPCAHRDSPRCLSQLGAGLVPSEFPFSLSFLCRHVAEGHSRVRWQAHAQQVSRRAFLSDNAHHTRTHTAGRQTTLTRETGHTRVLCVAIRASPAHSTAVSSLSAHSIFRAL
jgi:hypothetical protein